MNMDQEQADRLSILYGDALKALDEAAAITELTDAIVLGANTVSTRNQAAFLCELIGQFSVKA